MRSRRGRSIKVRNRGVWSSRGEEQLDEEEQQGNELHIEEHQGEKQRVVNSRGEEQQGKE